MFGRKAREIASLRAQLRDALENLVNVEVQLPLGVVTQIKELPRDHWYTFSSTFRVSKGATIAETSDVFIGEQDSMRYFDGVVGDWPAQNEGNNLIKNPSMELGHIHRFAPTMPNSVVEVCRCGKSRFVGGVDTD